MLQKSIRSLMQVQSRAYHPKWVPKYRDHYRPTYFDSFNNRRWDSIEKTTIRNYKTQDPLHFDHDRAYINGGVEVLLQHLHEKEEAEGFNLKTIAHLLYNMEKADIYDQSIYTKLEHFYKTNEDKNLVTRHAFGAVWAYYRSNCGTQFGLDYWEVKLEEMIDNLHCQEIHELMVAFRGNRRLHRSHFIKLLDNNYKAILMEKWQKEVVYNQKLLIELMVECDYLKWYDEEVWTRMVNTYIHKKKINNTHYFRTFHQIVSAVNENPNTGLAGKFDE